MSDRPPWGAFFDEYPDPCFAIRIEGSDFVMAHVNAAWERRSGLDAGQFLEKDATAHLPPASAAAARQRLRAAADSGVAESYDEELHFPAGTSTWRTCLIPWPRGQAPRYLLGIAYDLTNVVEAERALRHSEERFRRLAENAQDMVYLYRYEPRRCFEYVNPAVERILGYPREEYYAEPDLVARSIHPDDRELFLAFDRAPYDTQLVLRFIHKDGRVVWTEALATCERDESGRVTAVEGVARDITARKLQEEERSRFERRLLETQKLESLGVLAGGIAHDFNNLLTGVLGRVSLMRAESSEPNLREHLDCVEQAAVQAADLCRQMLAYSGKGRFSVRHLDLSELVRDTLQLLQLSISHRARLLLRLGQGLPPIAADAAQLRQALVNLVQNASEALADGKGTIVVETGWLEADREYLAGLRMSGELPEGRYVYLEVADDGSGIGGEIQDRIFEPFYSTKFTGRGLGLSAVLGIVRGHRGGIKLETSRGEGTRVRLHFPAVAGGESPSPPNQLAAAQRGAGTILVIDDEEVVRSVTARILKRLGFDAILAADGQEGLARFGDHFAVITAVLLDLTMPGLDGEAVFREIRARDATVPVLLMSGYNEQDAMARFAGMGLAGFLQKPFTIQQLAEKLRAIVPMEPAPSGQT